jgi:hypothetical protein
MPGKQTKTQCRRLLTSIRGKASTLWQQEPAKISTADYIAIEKIVNKNLKRLG